MAAIAVGNELHIAVALLEDAHRRVVAVHAAQGILDDGAALVAEHEQLDAVLLEPARQFGRAGAADLLRAGGRQVHVTFGGVAVADHFLHGLEESHQAALGVRRATAPDLAVRDGAGEGRMNPLAGGLHHVHVAHQEDGLLVGFALPLQQQVAVDFDLLTGGKNLREQLPHQLVEAAELLHFGFAAVGDGLHLHHAGKLPRVLIDALFIRGGNVAGLLAGQHQRPDDRDQQRGNQRRQQAEDDVQDDHASTSFLSALIGLMLR